MADDLASFLRYGGASNPRAFEFLSRLYAQQRPQAYEWQQYTAPTSEFTTPRDSNRERASRLLGVDPMAPFWGDGALPARHSQMANWLASTFAHAPYAMSAGPKLTMGPLQGRPHPFPANVGGLSEAFSYAPAQSGEIAALMGMPLRVIDRLGRYLGPASDEISDNNSIFGRLGIRDTPVARRVNRGQDTVDDGDPNEARVRAFRNHP